jgi:hypothetical protein
MGYPNCYWCAKEGKEDRGFMYGVVDEFGDPSERAPQCFKHYQEHHPSSPEARIKVKGTIWKEEG